MISNRATVTIRPAGPEEQMTSPPFDHTAATEDESMVVPCHRYTKPL